MWSRELAICVFFLVYLFIATEKIHKTIIALLGGMIVVIAGIVSQEEAFSAIDFNVLFLLLGMMVIVDVLQRTGVFQWAAIRSAKIAKGDPIIIMICYALITALFSAFLDNVTTVLLIIPTTILIVSQMDLDPVPFVIMEAVASNIGGTATLVGDPPNIMIGSAAGLGFNDFLKNTGVFVILNLVVLCFTVWFMFRKRLRISNERRAIILAMDEHRAIRDKKLLVKSLVVLFIVIIGFLVHSYVGIEPATVALFGASLLLMITGIPPEEVFKELEWATLMFFVGLFILVEGLVKTGTIAVLAEKSLSFTSGNVPLTGLVLLWGSGVFSSVVDNIPYVATMIPFLKYIGGSLGQDITPLWWALALGACLGGNGTLVGASANVVAAGVAKKSGYHISFIRFAKYGVLFTLQSLFLATVYIFIRYF